jgi:hypothetical protein
MDNAHLLLHDQLDGSPTLVTPPTRDDAIQQRVQELESQVQSYLARPTNANFKQAISLYERILGFGDINPAQRASFDRRLEETLHAYEQFRAQFGELTTARQIQRDEIELIELRKLINTGVEIGPDGEQLEPQFDKLLATVREKLLRIARELADQATKQAGDGTDYLDPQLLDAAIGTYERAIGCIQGAEIRGWEESVAATIAVSGIKSLLLNETAESTIKKYEQRVADVRDSRAAILRIRPLFDEADSAFRQSNYGQVIIILDSAQDLAGPQLSSSLVAGLRRRTMQHWEQATLARANTLLQAARMATSRGEYEQVEKLVSELLGLEPHLETEALTQYKQQTHALIKEIYTLEEYLQQLVNDSGLARIHGRMAEAEQRAREALVLRPDYLPAQQALESVLVILVNNALHQAQDALAAPDAPRMHAARDALELQHRYVEEIREQPVRQPLQERLNQTLGQLTRVLDQRSEIHAREQQAQALIDQAGQQALQERFADALATITAAHALTPQHPQLVTEENRVRAEWAETLRQRAQAFIDTDPPHPAAALECLATLREIGMEDTASIELRRRADWQANTARGIGLLQQGAFAQAIELLKQGDLADATTKNTLNEARYQEAQRLMQLDRWTPALKILQQIGGDDPQVLALSSRARAEYLIDQAKSFLEVKVFGGAESKLTEAERETLPELTDRIKQMREQINSARTVFRKAQTLQQRAQEQHQRYRSYGNPSDLLEAISTLDQALSLGDLPEEDHQRESIQKLRNEYQQRYQDLVLAERTRLMSVGDAALQTEQIERIPEAIQCYGAVLDLAPNQPDTEAISRLERARQLLRRGRDQLVDEAGVLLNLRGARNSQRGIRLSDVQALIARGIRAQQIAPETHRALNEALLALQEAARACETADIDIQAARTLWATARRQGSSDVPAIDHALQRAVRSFEGMTYIHSELDRSNADGLMRQITANREVQHVVVATSATVAGALARFDSEAAAAAFAELARAEEAVYTTATALAGIPSDTGAPVSLAERYPHQYAILNSLSEQTKAHMQREREAPDVQQLREIIQQRIVLQRLLERLDRENRFGLR